MARKHGFFRPHVAGLSGIYSTTLREGVGDIIRSIFADGTDGFYFDFSKTDRLFQSVTGSGTGGQLPADDAGENIGLALEAHGWNGLPLSAVIAAATEFVANGGFDSDLSGWTNASTGIGAATWDSTGGGRASLTRPDGSNIAILRQSFTTVVGRTYRVSIDVAGSDANFRAGTSAGATTNLTTAIAAGTGKIFNFVATATTTHIQVNANANGTTTYVDNISIKEVPGNPGTQATTSAQPKWQTGGLARFDGSDDNLLTTLVPGSAFTFMAKLKLPTTGASTKIISGCRSTTDTRAYLSLNNDGTLSAGLGTQTSLTIKGSVNRNAATGVAAFAFDGTRCELLWNAVREYEGAQSGGVQTTVPIALGALNDNGMINTFSNPDIYYGLAIKKRLTQAEISAVTNLWGTS